MSETARPTPSSSGANERMTESQVLELFKTLSNARRWGQDDELGTLNFITPAKRIQAAALVRTGQVLSLANDLDLAESPFNPRPVVHRMLLPRSLQNAVDQTEIAPHGLVITHLDALGHVSFNGKMYNDRNAADVVSVSGLNSCSVHASAGGIVTRGVLLDIPRALGIPYVGEADGVGPGDLDLAEELSGVKIESGDAVLVRCGSTVRQAELGPGSPEALPGIMPECLPWMHQREIAVYGGDCEDRVPSGYNRLREPVSQIGMVAMGLNFLDNLNLEALAEHCHASGEYAFLLVVAPLRIPRGTGSAVNPVAVF